MDIADQLAHVWLSMGRHGIEHPSSYTGGSQLSNDFVAIAAAANADSVLVPGMLAPGLDPRCSHSRDATAQVRGVRATPLQELWQAFQLGQTNGRVDIR